MPLEDYAGMTDADLGSIYDFLRTIPAGKAERAALRAAKSSKND